MRKLSQRQLLSMVIANWREQGPGPKFDRSTRSTAWFLVLLFLAGLLYAGLAVLLVGDFKEHRQHRARATGYIEGAQRLHQQAAGQAGDLVHGAEHATAKAVSA